jgi:hypothetical protein
MKHCAKFFVVALSLVSLLPVQVSACGGADLGNNWLNWFVQTQATAEHVMIGGQEMLHSVADATITNIQDLYNINPLLGKLFCLYCLNLAESPFNEVMLAQLKLAHLVQADATVSQLVKAIIANVIEIKPDGTIDIWSVDQMIAGGWAQILKV